MPDLPIQRPSVFQEELLPEGTALAGWAALVYAFQVKAPLRHLSCVSEHHVRGSIKKVNAWTVYDKRYLQNHRLADHLTFALRHEPLDLLVLKRVFLALPKTAMMQYVQSAPMGAYTRRAWFLYEYLTGETLDIPDATQGTAIDLLEPEKYITGPVRLSKRHKVRNNLLGSSRFCPMIRRTEDLNALMALTLSTQAQETIGKVSSSLIGRAASFMLLADSRASFEIEGERPPRSRLEKWGRAILQAGKRPLTMEEINRLHQLLIEDNRLVKAGLRVDGVFLGERTTDGEPLPEFVGAKPEDLSDLMAGLLEANAFMLQAEIDPVLQAAATSFGFVYIHPFEDGNGRLQRCLIHHVLAERKFTPPGLVFPVSSVMLSEIEIYQTTLQAHSAPLMPFIHWRPTPSRNVEVLNDTADLYRFFDCTDAVEFLYRCVQRTVEYDLPREIDYLGRHDTALQGIMKTVEMPDRLAEDFLMFTRQHGGTLPKKRRRQEFATLTDLEVERLEAVVNEAFEGY